MRVSALALYALLTAIALAWIGAAGRGFDAGHPAPWVDLGPLRAALVSAAAGATLGGLVVGATRWLAPRARWASALHTELRGLLEGVSIHDVPLLAVTSGVGEELLFRAAMLPAWGLVASSLVFGLAHPPLRPSLWPWTVWATVMGVVLGVLYASLGSVVGPIVAHAVINYGNLRFVLLEEAPSVRRYPG